MVDTKPPIRELRVLKEECHCGLVLGGFAGIYSLDARKNCPWKGVSPEACG